MISEPQEDVDDNQKDLSNMENAWRYAKKPLMSIGSKGATPTHGNSLRQLLEHHQIVKVKVNTRKYDGNLETAFKNLVELAVASGAPDNIELLHTRPSESIIMFGMPGLRQRILDGEFPPKENESIER